MRRCSAYDQPDAWTTARVIQGVRTFFDSDARWPRHERTRALERGRGSIDVGRRGRRSERAASRRRRTMRRAAVAMKQLAVDIGVPPERIVIEPNARTTREHPVELLHSASSNPAIRSALSLLRGIYPGLYVSLKKFLKTW